MKPAFMIPKIEVVGWWCRYVGVAFLQCGCRPRLCVGCEAEASQVTAVSRFRSERFIDLESLETRNTT